MRKYKFDIGDSVLITDGLCKGEEGIVARVPNKELGIKWYTVYTESHPNGVWCTLSNITNIDNEVIVESGEWLETIPNDFNPVQFMIEMAEIYPKYNQDHNIRNGFDVSVFTGEAEGPVPHCHVYYSGKKNKKDCAFICLGKAEYAPQHIKETKILNSKEIKNLIQFFKTIVPGIALEAPNGYIYKPTCWQLAVHIWLSGKQNTKLEKYFELDDNGIPIMPDYNDLKR